jgi:flagellar biosynthesis protein FlhG
MGSSPRIKRATQTLSVTSGKGGVGKSTIVSNLGLTLANRGKKVLLLDGDLGMGNLDIMFGYPSSNALQKALRGEIDLKDAMVELRSNLFLLPGGSGLYDLNHITSVQRQTLIDQIGALESEFDYLIIDTAPGIDDNVLSLNSAVQEIIVVITPDPSSLTDSYALMKVLNQRYRESRFSLLFNMVSDEREALRLFKAVSEIGEKHLDVHMSYRGFVPTDLNLRKTIRAQQLVVEKEPRCLASLSLKDLAENVSNYKEIPAAKGGLQFFWQQMIGVA